MSQFYNEDFGVSKMSSEELDKIMIEKGGVVGRIGYGYATHGDVGDHHGWGFRWVGTGGMGNHGTLVMVPRDHRTRKIHREATIARFEEAGLRGREAEIIYNSRLPYKHELMAVLASVIYNPLAVRTLAAFEHYGSRSQWEAVWGNCIPDEVRNLSVPRIVALVEMIKVCQ